MSQQLLRILGALFVLGLVATFGQAGEDKKKTTPVEIAHLRLEGSLEEGPGSEDPLLGALAEPFKHVIDRIHKARKDDKVQGLLLQLDGLEVGWGKVNELRQALEEFKKSGRKVYSYVEGGLAKDYIVATAGDRIVMPPSGWLLLVGTRAEIGFYKELFEKLGIRADFLQMGVFKFAAEPFTRSTMSKEARAQYEKVLSDFFESDYVGSISRSRKQLSPERVKALIDEGPFTPARAAEVGLIDEVAYRDQIDALIKKDLGGKEIKIVKDYGKRTDDEIDFTNPFAIFKLFAPRKSATGTHKHSIALIYAVGPITTGKGGESIFGGSVVGSTTMIKAIRQAEADPKVKAIVLRVDSPGGSALASDLIWHELKRCKKPVVASMSDVAASGGYYISMGASKVFAEPGTLTGSIGVVSGKLVLGGLWDKIGINTETIAYGKNSGIFSSMHAFSPSERRSMEILMQEVYDQFLQKTMENRIQAGKKFTRDGLIQFAEGRIWTGRQAKEHGLIDELGSFDDAIAEAKHLGGLARDAEVDYLILPKGQSLLESLLERGSAEAGVRLLASSELARSRELRPLLRGADALLQLRAEPVWMIMPHVLTQR